VWVFDAVEKQEAGAGREIVEIQVLMGRAQGDYSLMGRAGGQTVQSVARLEAEGHGKLAAERDDLLKAGPGCAFGDEHAIERAAGAERLEDGMKAEADGHYPMMQRGEGSVWGKPGCGRSSMSSPMPSEFSSATRVL
jgi:hypothetical protein